jgi:hypothetical protein
MTTMLATAHHVEVEAPDGAAALELEHTLYDLRPTAIFRGGHWVVDLPGVHSVDAVEAEVKSWLRLLGAGAATMRVDGRPHTVAPESRRRHRPSHGNFIG